MLNFFRKHQKFFFIIVTFFVVISFSFFGAFKTYSNTMQVSAKVVGKAVDGSSITDLELAAIERIVTTDTKKAGVPNLLHGEYLERVFLEPKVADVLVEQFFPLIQADLNERLKRVKAYQPYVHPEAPFINSLDAWTTLLPKVKEAYQKLLMQKEATPETFSLLSTIYLEQKRFPPEFIRQMLDMQLKQYSWLREDPMLRQRNLNLFGFDAVKDWFGPKFVRLLSSCIVNGAAVAREKGYCTTTKEAKADLIHNVIVAAEETCKQKLSVKDASGYLVQELGLLGLEEKGALDGWQRAVLFRQLLQSVGETVFHDALLYDTFANFASQTARVDLFELPGELRLDTFDDLMKFQFYLEKTAPDYAKQLDLPEKLLSPEEVEKVCPELVEEKLRLEISEVDLEELALAVSLRETWAWEGDDAHWKQLKKEFSELENKEAETSERRVAILDELDEEVRLNVDRFARLEMIKATPERIVEALAKAEPQTKWVSFRSGGKVNLSIQGVSDPHILFKKLQSVESLDRFSEDGIHYYTIKVLERGGGKRLLTFGEAKEDATFVKLVDRKLEEAYPKVRERDPKRFQMAEGRWKPLAEVKDAVGAYLFASILTEIEKVENPSQEKISFSFYPQRRFVPFMRRMKELFEKGEDLSQWIESEGGASSTIPWRVVRKETSISRGSSEGFNTDEILSLTEGQWSKVTPSEKGGVAFCRLLSHLEGSGNGNTSLNEKGKTALSAEAKRVYFKEMAQLFSDKQAIHLSQTEDEL